jgi:hypothetical protein
MWVSLRATGRSQDSDECIAVLVMNRRLKPTIEYRCF